MWLNVQKKESLTLVKNFRGWRHWMPQFMKTNYDQVFKPSPWKFKISRGQNRYSLLCDLSKH